MYVLVWQNVTLWQITFIESEFERECMHGKDTVNCDGRDGERAFNHATVGIDRSLSLLQANCVCASVLCPIESCIVMCHMFISYGFFFIFYVVYKSILYILPTTMLIIYNHKIFRSKWYTENLFEHTYTHIHTYIHIVIIINIIIHLIRHIYSIVWLTSTASHINPIMIIMLIK